MTKLGTLRRSQIVSTFGPGALVDYRAGGASGGTVSALTLGLDSWDVAQCRPLHEPALERLLGLRLLREPPVSIGSGHGGTHQGAREGGRGPATPALRATRFPRWLECPRCRALRPV